MFYAGAMVVKPQRLVSGQTFSTTVEVTDSQGSKGTETVVISVVGAPRGGTFTAMTSGSTPYQGVGLQTSFETRFTNWVSDFSPQYSVRYRVGSTTAAPVSALLASTNNVRSIKFPAQSDSYTVYVEGVIEDTVTKRRTVVRQDQTLTINSPISASNPASAVVNEILDTQLEADLQVDNIDGKCMVCGTDGSVRHRLM